MTLARCLILACLALILSTTPSRAHREDYIDETLVFVTLDAGELEPEYWLDVGHDNAQRFTRQNVALEYGITDHWMVDGRATALDEGAEGFHFDSGRFETRYRFFDEGTLPIDIAVSGEINTQREQDGHESFGVEPRLIFSKDFGQLNLTLNLAEEIPVSEGHSSFDLRGGWRYDANELFRLGTELHYDSQERSLTAIPQIWFTFPGDVTFKAGYSYDFGHSRQKFLRVAIEAGF